MWEKEKLLSPLPTVFSRDLYYRHVKTRACLGKLVKEVRAPSIKLAFFVAFVEDNATMSSIWYFENHVSHFVQNRRK